MKKTLNKISLILWTCFLLFITSNANANQLDLSPPKFEFTWNPWDVIKWNIKLANLNDFSIKLFVEKADFQAWSNESWIADIINPENVDSSISVSKWLFVNWGKDLVLEANEKVTVPFIMQISEDAEPWWHYWSIFFSLTKEDGQVRMKQKIWTLILVDVKWDVEKSGGLTHFLVTDRESFQWSEIEKMNSKYFFSEAPVNFIVRYENTWSVHIKPYWKIHVTNIFWEQMKKIWIEAVVNKFWVKVKDKIVDYIPVNNAKWNVLAHWVRSFNEAYKWTAKWTVTDEWDRWWIAFWGVPMWIYKVNMTLNTELWDFEENTWFVVYSIKNILLYLVIFLILLFWTFRIFRKNK